MQFATLPPASAIKGPRARRLLDVTAASAGLLLLSPVLAATALMVRLTSPGPALHRAVRVGQGGREFRLYKFRTMVARADRLGPGITPAGDSRITPLGAWLRRYKLDELPQLINVLKGEMTLVGPRPEDPRYVAHYTAEQRRVLDVPPGITSPASLHYRSESELLTGPDWETKYLKVVLPHKLQMELDYLNTRTMASDLRMIMNSIRVLLGFRIAQNGMEK